MLLQEDTTSAFIDHIVICAFFPHELFRPQRVKKMNKHKYEKLIKSQRKLGALNVRSK